MIAVLSVVTVYQATTTDFRPVKAAKVRSNFIINLLNTRSANSAICQYVIKKLHYLNLYGANVTLLMLLSGTVRQ